MGSGHHSGGLETPESTVEEARLGGGVTSSPGVLRLERSSQGCSGAKGHTWNQGTQDLGWVWPSLYINPLCFPFPILAMETLQGYEEAEMVPELCFANKGLYMFIMLGIPVS